MAAASGTPMIAQGNALMDPAQLSNPIDFYPQPPFKTQTQQWPGLASKMEPPPIMARRVTAVQADLPVAKR